MKKVITISSLCVCIIAALFILNKSSKNNDYMKYTEDNNVVGSIAGFEMYYTSDDRIKAIALKLSEMGYSGTISEVPSSGEDCISYFEGDPIEEYKYIIGSPDGHTYEAGYTTEGFEIVQTDISND